MAAITNSYVDVDYADTYHAEHGNTDWAGLSTPDKTTALINASQFVDNVARGKWKGCKATQAQALAWPRTDATDEDGYDIADTDIPLQLKDAVCEAALRISAGEDLMADGNKSIASESVAGVISTSYFEGKENVTNYRRIYGLLAGLVVGEIGMSSECGCAPVSRG